MRTRYEFFRLLAMPCVFLVSVACYAAPIQAVSSSGPTGLDITLSSASAAYTLYAGIAPVWANLQPGGFVQFNLAVATPGSYALTVYYSTTLENQSANILVNGVQQAVAQLPDTASWGSPQNNNSVSLKLPAGTVAMTIAAISGAPAFNIQGLTLTPIKTASTAPTQPISASAPSALDITLTTAFANYTLYRGSPPVWGNLQNDGFIEYTLSSSRAETYALAIHYSTTLSAMSAQVLVDGAPAGVANLTSTGSWNAFQNSVPVSIGLPAGTSTLRIAALGQYPAFNIEGLTLTPSAGSGSTAPIYPLAGQKLYVNPYTVSAQNPAACALLYPATPQLMSKIATQPQAVWFGNWNTNVRSDAVNLAALASVQDATPAIVVYNIPDRDCAGGYSSGGVDYPAYQTWVQNLAQGFGTMKVAVILEPDALSQIQSCNLTSQQQQDRYNLLTYAVSMFKTYTPNASIYIDAGHSNDSIAASDMAQRLQNAGVSSAAGFALNTSYYGDTASNVSYGQNISALLNNEHFVVDTGRNGNGATADAQWCNPPGRALGTPPQGFASGLVDAYLWIKNPGESDGACNGGPAAGQLDAPLACGLAHAAAW